MLRADRGENASLPGDCSPAATAALTGECFVSAFHLLAKGELGMLELGILFSSSFGVRGRFSFSGVVLCRGLGFGGGDWAMMLCSLFGDIPISLQTPLESLGMIRGLGGDISNSSCLGFLILLIISLIPRPGVTLDWYLPGDFGGRGWLGQDSQGLPRPRTPHLELCRPETDRQSLDSGSAFPW